MDNEIQLTAMAWRSSGFQRLSIDSSSLKDDVEGSWTAEARTCCQ